MNEAIVNFKTCLIIVLPEADSVICISKLTGDCSTHRIDEFERIVRQVLGQKSS